MHTCRVTRLRWFSGLRWGNAVSMIDETDVGLAGHDRHGIVHGGMGPQENQVPGRASVREITTRAEAAIRRLEACDLCPRKCNVNRAGGGLGVCGIGPHARVASYAPHFGEESVLVGRTGSGTIFFGGCNLLCCFCQNHDISHRAAGTETPG